MLLIRDYDMHGPAGPTAFWKTSDEVEEEKSSTESPLPYLWEVHDDSDED